MPPEASISTIRTKFLAVVFLSKKYISLGSVTLLL
jgi:hypothetical protein